MGWWKIKDVETGRIDFDNKCPLKSQLVNAIPKHNDDFNLYNGDGPADLMDDALYKISKQYEDAWGRPAKHDELLAVFNFCTGMMFA